MTLSFRLSNFHLSRASFRLIFRLEKSVVTTYRFMASLLRGVLMKAIEVAQRTLRTSLVLCSPDYLLRLLLKLLELTRLFDGRINAEEIDKCFRGLNFEKSPISAIRVTAVMKPIPASHTGAQYFFEKQLQKYRI